MGNGLTAVSEFKNVVGRRVELENRYGSLAHREFKSLPLRSTLRLVVAPVARPVSMSSRKAAA